ncbi:hypothetical protein EXIGLDRAFT_830432 [Exidia glandulosa HHB12029]|uniref:Uncharacterized protein n=1 Tax=Exidia glandulosa HHB12029 TaxID=1314781 RepID=A0A165NHI5_EXIGL|nr:hypothetical protein EXIGLDRAFT_830432 [Exidia glandulosa HHB12029]
MSSSSASALPPEILLLVFESAVDYMPGFIDPDALQSAYERNYTLTACAVVCKSWAAPAQMALFRDITLGITADDVDEDEIADNDDGERCRPGRTTPALASLVSTLEKFRDSVSTIPNSIRAIHLCIGETDMTGVENPEFDLDNIIHGSPADVFRAIALCPGLVHLSIVLGLYREDDERSIAPMFSAEDIAMLKAGVADLPNLRQLSIQTQDDTEFIKFCRYRIIPAESSNTLIAALSDRLALLNVSIDGGRAPDEDKPEAGSQPISAFPMLHTFRNEGDTSNIRTAILQHAPRLRRVELPWYLTVAHAKLVAPEFVEELKLGSVREEDDLASFSQLEVLELDDFVRVTKTDLPVLRTLPRTLRKIVLPATAFEVDSLAEKVADALRGLPNLESITAMQVPWSPAVVKQVCHLPVHIVPQSQLWQQRLIPCAE